ncbi:hypothetical protein AB0I16_11305 [Streptomyces sp. NPDC050703]|uniref:hypothetical protein n=1 Tax=Streptomyces sp. NPDC050703 TaxID=3157218 RepID=UPI003423C2F2
MGQRGRTIKVTAVLVLSALALTGFVPERGRGGGSRSGGDGGGGGGGCSSSSQDHDSSSSDRSGSSGSGTSGSYDDDDDDAYGGSGEGRRGGDGGHHRRPNGRSTASASPGDGDGDGGRQEPEAKAELVRCATRTTPYATVKVTNSDDRKGRFWVSVTFVDAAGITIIEESEKVTVRRKSHRTVRVELSGGGLQNSVDHCEVEPRALSVSG